MIVVSSSSSWKILRVVVNKKSVSFISPSWMTQSCTYYKHATTDSRFCMARCIGRTRQFTYTSLCSAHLRFSRRFTFVQERSTSFISGLLSPGQDGLHLTLDLHIALYYKPRRRKMLRKSIATLGKTPQLAVPCFQTTSAVGNTNFHSSPSTLLRRRHYDNGNPRILITGSLGQLGMGLARLFREKYGKENVFMSDIRKPTEEITASGPYIFADVLDYKCLQKIVVTHRIDWLVHFSALLSAVAEQNVALSMKVNIEGTHNAIELANQYGLRLFIPSTIAAFGPESPRNPTPNLTIQRPKTIYGVAKVHTELLGEYFNHKFGLDFRCLRFPGVLSSDTHPGGGTTDYAIQIFHAALKDGRYTSYLHPDTRLPMMHINDCLRSVAEFMELPAKSLIQRTYNVTGESFTPGELANEIRKSVPNFELDYRPDHRQAIADTWPEVFDDSCARREWNWVPQYDTKKMASSMIDDLRPLYTNYTSEDPEPISATA